MKERKKNRLKSFDYSSCGCYFITICTNKKQNYFGKINEGILILNDYGRIAKKLWAGLPKVFKNICLDIFVIMPNHLHGIIAITEELKERINVGNATLHKSKSSNIDFPNQLIIGGKIDSELHSLQGDYSLDRTKMYLSKVIQIYKAETTRRVKRISNFKINTSIWQKSFYDRIIRSEKELYNIQQYIFENPVRWQADIENKDVKISDIEYYDKIFKA